jgi:ubiquinone biosynthesis protein
VNLETGQIGFLDMGLMGEMNRTQRMGLADVLVSFVEKDGYNLGKAILRLSVPIRGAVVDENAFLENMDMFARRFLVDDVTMDATLDALQNIMGRYGLRLDSNFVLAFKALMQVDQIIRALDPEMVFTEVAVSSSRAELLEQFNAETVANMFGKQLSRSSREVIYRLPSLVEATTKWLDQYEKGRMSLHVDTSDLTPQVEKLDRALSNSLDRLLVGLVMAGWLVGAAIASTIDIQVMGYSISDVAFYMFMIGAVIGAIVVYQAVRRLNREEDFD